jgi:prophage regulatory protein
MTQPTLLSRSQVLARLGGKSVSWLYSEMAEGRIPRPIRLGRTSVAWVESEINEYIEHQIAHERVTLTQKARVWKRKASTACAA